MITELIGETEVLFFSNHIPVGKTFRDTRFFL